MLGPAEVSIPCAVLRSTTLLTITAALMGCASSPDPLPDRSDSPQTAAPMASLHPGLVQTVERAREASLQISETRRAALDAIASHVSQRRSSGETARLLFICTHNSRRSHMGQLWAAVAAAYFGIDGVQTYSGGTEATAFNPRAVAALQRAGLEITRTESQTDNPQYAVSLGSELPTLTAFSKRYMDPPNPSEGFVAIMTCSDADKSCPFVPGADLRVSLAYVDPKVSDGTPDEARTYDERSFQIASEMVYLFSRIDGAG